MVHWIEAPLGEQMGFLHSSHHVDLSMGFQSHNPAAPNLK
jgi:hypothetical protein